MSINQTPKKPPFVATRVLANGSGELTISGVIDAKDNTGSVVVSALHELENSCSHITICLNCYGGAVTEGLAIIEAIQKSTSKITTHVSGIAASMGAMIWFAGETRTMSPHAMLMTHQPSATVSGKASDLRGAADMIDGMIGQLAEMISVCLGITPEEAKVDYLTEKDRYITPSEAIKLGICFKVKGQVLKAVAELTSAAAISETAEDAEEIYSKIANYAQQGKDSIKFKTMIKVIALLGLAAEATEDEVSAKVQSLQAENENLRLDMAALGKAKVVALVTQALADKKIVEAQKDAFIKLAEQDYESAASVLAGMTAQGTPAPVGKQKSIAEMIAEAQAAGKAKPDLEVTYDSLSKTNPEALAKMQTEQPEAFAALFEAQYGKAYKPLN